jgi:DNA-binding NarL/FixJ family response regulator
MVVISVRIQIRFSLILSTAPFPFFKNPSVSTGGYLYYSSMKEINANVAVLLSSGYSIDGQATEIMERGCDGFIQKTFNMKQLSHKVLEVLYKDR